MADKKRAAGDGAIQGGAAAFQRAEIIHRTDAARCDDRHVDGICDCAGQRQIEAGLGAIAVHRGQKDLARAARRHVARVPASQSAGQGGREVEHEHDRELALDRFGDPAHVRGEHLDEGVPVGSRLAE